MVGGGPGAGIAETHRTAMRLDDKCVLVAGVFLGSALWWLLLSGGVTLLRARFRPAALVWVNRISGAVIVLFGLFSLASIVPLPR